MVLVDQEERLHELIDVAEKFGQLFNAVATPKTLFWRKSYGADRR
jgi:hypothetical protein